MTLAMSRQLSSYGLPVSGDDEYPDSRATLCGGKNPHHCLPGVFIAACGKRRTRLDRATVAAKLSALSSLYKALADERLCAINPVSAVKRPKTGNGGLGSGKTPGLDRTNVCAMLDAPNTDTLLGFA